jgi:hypothetical protein
LTQIDKIKLDKASPHLLEKLEGYFAEALATTFEIYGYIQALSLSRTKDYVNRFFQGLDSKLVQLYEKIDDYVEDATDLISIDKANNPEGAKQSTYFTELTQSLDTLGNTRMSAGLLTETRTKAIAGTHMWLMDDPVFQGWFERRDPLLWICGGPGVGKTYIAGSLISNLQYSKSAKASAPTASVVYFFFSKTTVATSPTSISHALQAMAHQLSLKDIYYKRHLQSLSGMTIQDSMLGLWQKLFVGYFSTGGRSLSMILDGVDEIMGDGECEPGQFLSLMSDILRKFLV